ncbi:hypothetical protein TNIN_272301 [Trichonephila inaurata madagascariensis]|uniref:Uncharacterized protein n=1 Tax=Trichonephila inaurata madagascariensis TaxID=2747483 RepID=A0A8X7BXY8_9ARAC|nr:hypothetical protein TNIN_272301 [Trichonephila inaurata madagascariensis]
MFSDGGKRKTKKEGEEELVGAVFSNRDKDQGDKSDETEEKKKLRNKVRFQRYRDKRKRDVTINSRISQHQAITVEEKIIIKRRKDNSKKKTNKNKATNGIDIRKEKLI